MTQKQIAFLEALLTQPTITKASEKAGISRTTAYRFLNDKDFKIELRKRQDECISDAVRFLQGKLTLCSARLAKIAADPSTPSQVAINACNAIFAACRSITETEEVIERIAAIEAALKENE